MEILDVINGRINKVMRIILLLTFGAMVLSVFAQVLSRHIGWIPPLPWSEEVARYTFIWATFIGASVAFYEGGHIRVSMAVDLIRNLRAKAAVALLADGFCLWFLGMYVWEGFVLTQRVYSLGQVSPALSSLPIAFIYMAIPLGSLFMGLNVLTHALRHMNTIRTGN